MEIRSAVLELLRADRQRTGSFLQLCVANALQTNRTDILMFIGMFNKDNETVEFSMPQTSTRNFTYTQIVG
jgi:hypothetical protein